MINRQSIGKKLVIAIFIGFLVPYALGAVYFKGTMEGWLYNANISQNKIMLKQTAKLIDDSILKNIENIAYIMAADEELKGNMNHFRNYTHLIDDSGNISAQEKHVLDYLKIIADNQDSISFISVGSVNGNYIEYPQINIDKSYDPRTRPWYQNAIANDKAVISEPYISKITKDTIVGVSCKIEDNDKLLGVLSINIKLETLMDNINRLEYGDTGSILILSPENLLINSPADDTLITKNINVALDKYSGIIKNIDKEFYEVNIDGDTKIVNVYTSPYNGWKYISLIDKKEVLAQADSTVNTLTGVYFVATLIALWVLIIVSRKITRPILAISKSINNMASFNFESYKAENLDEYIIRNDEVGEIALALDNMQSSFLELRDSMAEMDMQIKEINVSEREKYNLKLSNRNSFTSIANSINELLDRMYDYKEKINFLAQNDPMTNLPNRRTFNEKLVKVLSEDKEGGVILLDIDNFKGINDTLGHLFGDKVLQEVSSRLKRFSGENVFISRFGGDEFLILYTCLEDRDEIINFILNIFVSMDEIFKIEENTMKIEFSMGIAFFPKDSNDMDQLIKYADLAMYSVKNTGKNNYVFFNQSMEVELNKKQEIRDMLEIAIEKEAFNVLYQPQVDIKTGNISGYEGLIRMKEHNIPAGVFIEVAEDNGMIIPIGRIVTKKIIEQMSTWKKKGYELKPISINFSPMQIHDTNYKNFLIELLKEHDIDPKLIVIEITEGVFLDHKDSTIHLLNELRKQGIKIAIDDFGTGFSSLSYITSLPIDTIKFDRMLSLKFLEHEDIGVVKSLVYLAHSLNLKVVAEGIETKSQVDKLLKAECDIIQGYYYSKPIEPEIVEANYYKVYDNK